MLKLLREGAKRLGAATTPGAKRGGTKKGGGSKYYKRDKDTGQVKSLSEKKLTRRGAGVAAAGAATGAAGAAAASKGDKPKAKAKTSRRGPSMKEAGANIRKSKEAFERRRRSNRQAESAMRSVQKSRALGEAAARDPKATKPPKPEAPPMASVKQEREKAPKTRVAVEKPKAPKVEVKPNVVPRVYATPKSNRKLVRDEKAAKRSAAKSGSTTKTRSKQRIGTGSNMYLDDGRLNISKDNLDATGMTLTQYANYMKKNKKRPPKAQKKMGGGMMKSKMASKGGARGGKKMMPGGMRDGGMAKKDGPRDGSGVKVKRARFLKDAKSGSATKVKKKFPDLTGDGRVTQADILKGRGVTKKRNGGMMKSKGMAKGGAMTKKGMAKGGAMTKKGMAKGGAAMKKKGYAKGGMAKKGYSKGGAVRGKPRGVGVALRGYGKALKK